MTDRAKPTRFYVDGPDIVERHEGKETARIQIAALPAWLIVEGYVAMRSKGLSVDTCPDRTLPTERVRTPRVTEDMKWREAIAMATAEYETRAGFVGVPKDAKDAAIADGRTYAAALTPADVKDLKGRASVMQQYAKLYADKTPMEVKREPAQLDQAAD